MKQVKMIPLKVDVLGGLLAGTGIALLEVTDKDFLKQAAETLKGKVDARIAKGVLTPLDEFNLGASFAQEDFGINWSYSIANKFYLSLEFDAAINKSKGDWFQNAVLQFKTAF